MNIQAASTGKITGTVSTAKQAPQTAAGSLPVPDHIVIVIEENHGEGQIIGDKPVQPDLYHQIVGNAQDAPYINSLAKEGALFTDSHGVMHPSTPNYLALFSGSTHGATTDNCPPPGAPYSTPNLAEQLMNHGYTFEGYGESMPQPGFTGCQSGLYVRKHCPWVNWPSLSKESQPFTAFPTDFSKLPTVSFVIPNLNDDMHNGTVQQGDTWLKDNISQYAQWAKTHNSLLIVTFDEDDFTPANHIPTIFVGQMVKPGQYSETINHYNVLRTIEAMYGLSALGNAAQAQPITDVWQSTVNAAQASNPEKTSANSAAA
jgi:hypothetical protein